MTKTNILVIQKYKMKMTELVIQSFILTVFNTGLLRNSVVKKFQKIRPRLMNTKISKIWEPNLEILTMLAWFILLVLRTQN